MPPRDALKWYAFENLVANLYRNLRAEKVLQNVLSSHTNLEYLPLVIIPDNEKFYESSKEVASINGFHTQLVKLETFNKAVEYLSNIEDGDIPQDVRERLEVALGSLITNICGGVYVEFLIQKSKAVGKISGPLTWVFS